MSFTTIPSAITLPRSVPCVDVKLQIFVIKYEKNTHLQQNDFKKYLIRAQVHGDSPIIDDIFVLLLIIGYAIR